MHSLIITSTLLAAIAYQYHHFSHSKNRVTFTYSSTDDSSGELMIMKLRFLKLTSVIALVDYLYLDLVAVLVLLSVLTMCLLLSIVCVC